MWIILGIIFFILIISGEPSLILGAILGGIAFFIFRNFLALGLGFFIGIAIGGSKS